MLEDIALAIGLLAALWLMERGGRLFHPGRGRRRIVVHGAHTPRRVGPRG